MNNYLHAKENNINRYYLGILLCLITFGFYKNGILVYKYSKDLMILFKPLIFPLISIAISLILTLIKTRKFKINDDLIYSLLLCVILPIKTSILIYSIIIFIYNIISIFILDKINIHLNHIMIFKLVIIGILYYLNKYNYANNLEIIDKYSYDLLDIFVGRGIGGICSSSILISLIGYFILTTNNYYKSEIPLISILLYLIGTLIYKIIFHKVIIINSLIIFSLIFIAPLNKLSPGEKKMRIIYSISLGILTFIFTYFVNVYDGVSFAILASSLLNYIYLK